MRVFAVVLLVLSACAANPTTRDVGDFCGVPADACGKRLVDDHGQVHVVVCATAKPER
jgi:hypothetical protein